VRSNSSPPPRSSRAQAVKRLMIGRNRIDPRGLSKHTFAWHHTSNIPTEISATYAWPKWHSSGASTCVGPL
jgi:hypothetical protein